MTTSKDEVEADQPDSSLKSDEKLEAEEDGPSGSKNAGASAARKARISGVEPHEESPEGAAASEKPENPEDDLISKETLLPGIAEFMNLSETPLYMTFSELGQCITEEETAKINKLAKMTPEQLVERIKTMHDEIYQLGLREAKEMTRGKLLGIFAPERLPNPRWSDYPHLDYS